MKLVRRSAFLNAKEVEQNGYIIIDKNINNDMQDKVAKDGPMALQGTVLDTQVHEKGGAIPLPSKYSLVNIAYARKVSGRKWLPMNKWLISNLYKRNRDCVWDITEGTYIFVPPTISMPYTTETGLDVMSLLQRRFNDIVEYHESWITIGKRYDQYLELSLIKAYNRLLEEIGRTLLRKSGLYDRAVGCLWEYSLRAVIVPDPSLNLNEVEIPAKVIMRWLAKKEFREAYNIPEDMSIRDAVREMAGKRVMLGRQPSHDTSNLLSFKLRVRA